MTQRTDDLTAVAIAGIVLVIVAIQLALPDSVTVGPDWLIPVIELLGLPLGWFLLSNRAEAPWRRAVVGVWIAFLVLASILNATLLFVDLLRGSSESADGLLFAGLGVLAINVLSFAIIYWWLDGGGPEERSASDPVGDRDFLFPQQGTVDGWTPALMDYCFTAYTNSIAFSPTDTMPLSHRAKFLFTIQSTVALVTILVTLSRAINLIQ